MRSTGSPEEWNRKASRTLASARLLLSDGDFDGACSRAYYAIFYAAHVALFALGFGEAATAAKTHRGIIALFSRDVIKPGHFSLDLGKALDQVEQLRLTSDYFETSVSASQAAWAVDRAAAFLQAAETLSGGIRLDRPDQPPSP